MPHLNIEVKARLSSVDGIRDYLKENGAEFKGTDHQIDTYFKVGKGRLKLREGNIENYLIYYERDSVSGPKKSEVILVETNANSKLKELLMKLFDVLVVVDKRREIYFINNVKFHIDTVKGLGRFVEIEAIDYRGVIGIKRLEQQCKRFMALFKVKETIAGSYSDLLIEKMAKG